MVKDKINKWETFVEHIDTEAIIDDSLTQRLTPMLFNEHVVNMAVSSSFDVLV